MFKSVLIIYAILLVAALLIGIIVSIFDKSYKKHYFFSKKEDVEEIEGSLDEDDFDNTKPQEDLFNYNNIVEDSNEELGSPMSFDPISIKNKEVERINYDNNDFYEKDIDNKKSFDNDNIDKLSDEDDKFDDFFNEVEDDKDDLEDFDEENYD